MRNFLDTASIAQSLDGERLMGSLHFPNHRIVSDQFGYKEAEYTMRLLTGPNREIADLPGVLAKDSHLIFDSAAAESVPGNFRSCAGFQPSYAKHA